MASLLCAAGPASADLYEDRPAALALGPGVVSVFARGADGALYTATRTDGVWSGWSSLGGALESGPGVALYDGQLSMFARGPEGAGWVQFAQGPQLSGWQSLGGRLTSAASATQLRGTNELWGFLRGEDNAMYYKVYKDGGWTPWQVILPGNLASGPSAISRVNGLIDLFSRAPNGTLVQRSWVGGQWWPDWQNLGGALTSAPAAVAPVATNIEVFGRGDDGAIWRKSWHDSSGWSGWSKVDPTTVSSAPAAVSDAPGRITLFARIGDAVAVNDLDAGAWSGWKPLASVGPTPAPPPACLLPASPAGGPRLSAAFMRRRGAVIRKRGRTAVVRFGRHTQVRGQLTDAAGQPLSGANVCVGTRDERVGAQLQQTSAVTDATGRFVYEVPRGPSRRIRFAYRDAAGSVAEARIRLRVRAGVRLAASRRVLRNRQKVVLRGRLRGRPYPRGGVVVEVQVWRAETRRWQTFEVVDAGRRGRFRFAYRFTRTFTPQTYRFRARVRRQATYPYATGASHPLRVRVRPGR